MVCTQSLKRQIRHGAYNKREKNDRVQACSVQVFKVVGTLGAAIQNIANTPCSLDE